MSTFGHDEPNLCACGQKIGHAASCLFTRRVSHEKVGELAGIPIYTDNTLPEGAVELRSKVDGIRIQTKTE